MAELGKYNFLKINRFTDFGAYVDGEDLGEILVPMKYIPEGDWSRTYSSHLESRNLV